MGGVGRSDESGVLTLTPSRRELGVVYLGAIGCLFFAFGVSQFVTSARPDPPDVGTVVFFGTNLVLAGGLVGVGGWLYTSPLSDERALDVAKWSAVGLTVPTLVVFVAMAFDPGMGDATGHLTMAFATGGVVGALYGSVNALEGEHERVKTLHQRNQVLQRVFRHNIRNGMNVVEGYSQLLGQDAGGDRGEIAEKIQREARAVVDLADVTRNLTIDGNGESAPVDLVSVVTELLETLEEYYPAATFETDLPEEAWVAADASVEIALWHLLEFEIHRESASPVSIAVSEGDRVTLTIADTGADLAPEVIDALEGGDERPLEHHDGMELWVVKWLVETLGGEFTVRRNDPRGVRTRIAFDSRAPDGGP